MFINQFIYEPHDETIKAVPLTIQFSLGYFESKYTSVNKLVFSP